MPSYNMLPYVGLCGGGVRTVGTRVGLCQLAVGVDMVIQMAPARYFWVILETDLVLKYFRTSRLTKL